MGKWRTPEQRIAEAEAKIARATVSMRKKERSDDLRRKILIGAMMLDRAAKNPTDELQLMMSLSRYLTREIDRELFDLPPLPKLT